jgi:hypothetical protein
MVIIPNTRIEYLSSVLAFGKWHHRKKEEISSVSIFRIEESISQANENQEHCDRTLLNEHYSIKTYVWVDV